jgi:predicted DNA-binding transcriptional regulator AlpA
MEDELLTMNQAAELLKVSRAMIYLFIKDSEHPLPVFHIAEQSPRIKLSDLQKWIQEKKEADTM